jgi:bidirectional [NiFe] hydrogenase diaphorase subunit
MSNQIESESGLIDFIINGKPVQARPGWTILETAQQYHIHIPTLCFHPAVKPWGGCRLCVVEIRYGKRGKVIASCINPPIEELEVFTHSERAQNVRRWVLEMLLADCPASPEIRKLAAEHGVTSTRFPITNPEEDCIKCGRCVAVCTEVVGVQALTFGSRGVTKQLDTPYRVPNNDCVACGCCATVCPTGAMIARIDRVRGDISRRTGHGYAH